jgi:hypothetical protein
LYMLQMPDVRANGAAPGRLSICDGGGAKSAADWGSGTGVMKPTSPISIRLIPSELTFESSTSGGKPDDEKARHRASQLPQGQLKIVANQAASCAGSSQQQRLKPLGPSAWPRSLASRTAAAGRRALEALIADRSSERSARLTPCRSAARPLRSPRHHVDLSASRNAIGP